MSSSMIYFNEKRSQHIDKLIYQEQKGKTWIKTSQLKVYLTMLIISLEMVDISFAVSQK